MTRTTRIGGTWLALGFVVTLFLAAAAPVALGYHSFVLRSASMGPTLEPGDIEVVQTIAPLSARVGEIVTFRDPQRQDQLVSHRVRAIERNGGRVEFVTQGDANTGRERWSVPVDGTIGRLAYRVPKLGWVVVWSQTPAGRVTLIVLPALLLLVSLLQRLWRQPPGRTETPHGSGA